MRRENAADDRRSGCGAANVVSYSQSGSSPGPGLVATVVECAKVGGQYLGDNSLCTPVTCDPNAVPTVSEWGLVVLLLLGLSMGTIAFGRPSEATGIN